MCRSRCTVEEGGAQIGSERPRVGVVVVIQTCVNVGELLPVVYLAPFEAAVGNLRRVGGAARLRFGRNSAAGRANQWTSRVVDRKFRLPGMAMLQLSARYHMMDGGAGARYGMIVTEGEGGWWCFQRQDCGW